MAVYAEEILKQNRNIESQNNVYPYTVLGFFVKKITRIMTLFGLLFLILMSRKISIKAKGKTDTILTIVAGFLLAVHWATFFQSVQMGSVAIGTITFSTFPLFLLLLELLQFTEIMAIGLF